MAEHLARIFGTEEDKYVLLPFAVRQFCCGDLPCCFHYAVPHAVAFSWFCAGSTVPSTTRSVPVVMETVVLASI